MNLKNKITLFILSVNILGASNNLPDTFIKHEIKCENGIFYSCYVMGALYDQGINTNDIHIVPDKTKAIYFYKKSCDGDNIKACAILGALYMQEGGKTNEIMARKYFEKACNAGNKTSCTLLRSLPHHETRDLFNTILKGKS